MNEHKGPLLLSAKDIVISFNLLMKCNKDII